MCSCAITCALVRRSAACPGRYTAATPTGGHLLPPHSWHGVILCCSTQVTIRSLPTACMESSYAALLRWLSPPSPQLAWSHPMLLYLGNYLLPPHSWHGVILCCSAEVTIRTSQSLSLARVLSWSIRLPSLLLLHRTLSVMFWSSRTGMKTVRSSTRFAKLSFSCSFSPISLWHSSWYSEPFHILTLHYIHEPFGRFQYLLLLQRTLSVILWSSRTILNTFRSFIQAFAKLSCLCSFSPFILWGSSWCTKLFHIFTLHYIHKKFGRFLNLLLVQRTLSVILWSSRTSMKTFRNSTRFCKVILFYVAFSLTLWDSSWCIKLFYIVHPSFSRCFFGAGTFFVPTAIPRKLYTQSTYSWGIYVLCVYNVPPPPEPKGGRAHTCLRVRGWGESQFGRLEKKLSTLVYSVAVQYKV